MARRVRRPSVTASQSYPQIIAVLRQATLISRPSSPPRHSRYGDSSATASLWSGSTTFLRAALLRIRLGGLLWFDGLRPPRFMSRSSTRSVKLVAQCSFDVGPLVGPFRHRDA